MLRHNVLHHCCVNQSSLDDYFIVAAGVLGKACCVPFFVRNVRGNAEVCIPERYKNVRVLLFW